MARVYDYALAAKLKRPGIRPMLPADAEVPDEWLALLDQLHGQPVRDDGVDRPPADRA